MTSLDRTPGTSRLLAGSRSFWAQIVISLAVLTAVVLLALTGHGDAALAAGAVGVAGGGLQVTVHIHNKR
ncbi:hypothetical protein GCM10010250_67520 [Streptomyces althioticus]|uniref:hypothetical protein n=1 Tax=Streptomyces althioticus TaxID=83380 RepID=UPI001874DCC3|nr:hypothetical protein GCM10010250_67520 [Streptomyces althioticus]